MLYSLHGKWFYLLGSSLLAILPIFTWRRCIKTLMQIERENEEIELFHKRHNCCVVYFKGKGSLGWPPYKERLSIDLQNKNAIYEPLLYFLRTAEVSLDIAVMTITVNCIVETILEVVKKGVKVRLVLNYAGDQSPALLNLEKAGTAIRYFIDDASTAQSIMHHKYAVKDYNETQKAGYVLFGSINWTNSAFVENYENITFLSSSAVVEAFHDNFEQLWSFLGEEYKNNLLITAILKNKICIK